MSRVFLTKARLVLGAAIALGIAAPAFALGLAVEDHRTGERFDCQRLPGQRFSVTFMHSVSRTPVEDVYSLRDPAEASPAIIQTAEHFTTHGQGLPSMEGEPEVHRLDRTRTGFVAHMRRPIPKLIIRAREEFGNTLRMGDHRVDLTQWPDRPLQIRPVGDCESDG